MDIKIIGAAVLSMLLFACGTKKEGNSKPEIPVVIVIKNSVPHCGGAQPMPDEEWPKIENFVGCNLYVHETNKDGSRGKQVADFTTTDAGQANLNLPKGKYQLWAVNKLEAFERFVELEMEVTGTYDYQDEACFKAWYDKPDFEFEVGKETEYTFIYKNRCFTGSHPCMIYTGQYPP